MKKRVVLTTLAAVLLLAAAIAAGLNAIFTVTHVRTQFLTYSEEGKREAVELREKLDEFIGSSTTFLDLDEVAGVVTQYPCFRVDSIAKSFPATVSLEISERKERFAFRREEGYAILDEEGVYLYEKAENVNRISGENILLENFPIEVGEEGVSGDYFTELLSVMNTFAGTLREIRSNILSVTLVRATTNPRDDFFRIQMREGVVIDLGNPAVKAEEKTEKALQKYLSLGDEERIFGFITAVDSPTTGEALEPDYSRDSKLR